MRSIRLLGAAATTVGLLALSACGGSAGSANSSGSYGDCKVYGTKGSVKIHPVTPGVLTVQTNSKDKHSTGTSSGTFYNSYSLLKSLEAGLGLPCLNHACDSDVHVMSDLFGWMNSDE